jgi:hypothetical protein
MSVEISITDQIVEINEVSNPVEISVSAGASVSPVWGAITGTLSNQTDLQNALNAKFDDPTGTTAQYLRGDGTLATFPSLTGFVPYTGATANVDLGTHTILAQNATISSTGSGNTATITHSSGSGIGLNITKGGNGEGLYINKTSGSGNAATIIGTLNATSLVKSGGTSTQYLMADGSTSTLTNPITGTGTSGQVAYFTGATTQAGTSFFTTTGSTVVLNRENDNNAVPYLSITNGNANLRVNLSGDQARITTGSGRLSIDGNLVMLSSRGIYLSNVGIYTSNTRTAILVTENNDTIGTRTSAVTLGESLGNSIQSTSILGVFTNWRTGLTVNSQSRLDGQSSNLGLIGSYFGQTITAPANNSFLASVVIRPTFTNGAFTGITNVGLGIENSLGYSIYQTGTAPSYFNGNLLLGSTTNAGQRLQVTGDTLLKGSGATSATTALTVQNSAGNALFSIANDGSISQNVINSTFTIGGPLRFVSTSASIASTNIAIESAVSGSLNIVKSAATLSTSGSISVLNMGTASGGFRAFAPTSGTATYTVANILAEISQSGGANGITRGLYVNPTLTAAADWRSIEWSNNSGWGLYGAGTSNNYLGGALLIGTTTTAARLTVWDGDIFIKSDRFIGAGNTQASYGSVWNRIQLYSASNGDMSITMHNTNWWLRHNANASIAGNLLIGSTTDSGEKLQVTGTAKITGAVNIGNATDSVILANSSTIATANTLTIKSSAANTNTMFDVRPTGTANTLSGFILRDSETAATGSNVMLIGRGNAALPEAGVSYLGNLVAGTVNANSFHLGFLVSNVSLGRFEAMRMFNSGNVLLQNGGTYTDTGEKLQVTGTAKITSKLSMGAGTTSNAQINLASSTAPTSPNNGDIWFDGTDLKMRIGGVTKTFTLL